MIPPLPGLCDSSRYRQERLRLFEHRSNARATVPFRIVELLTLLIEDFEEKNYSLPPAAPREVVRHLMESNSLRQVDLIDVFGAESTVSEVLNGKRDLAKSHIEKLSLRFKVSPELFFEPRPKSSTPA